jgi:hypothetical protein
VCREFVLGVREPTELKRLFAGIIRLLNNGYLVPPGACLALSCACLAVPLRSLTVFAAACCVLRAARWQAYSTYLPWSQKRLDCFQELFVLVWKLFDESPYAMQYLITTLNGETALKLLNPLLYFMYQSKNDPGTDGCAVVPYCCAVLCCAVLCCAVPCCAVLCCFSPALSPALPCPGLCGAVRSQNRFAVHVRVHSAAAVRRA